MPNERCPFIYCPRGKNETWEDAPDDDSHDRDDDPEKASAIKFLAYWYMDVKSADANVTHSNYAHSTYANSYYAFADAIANTHSGPANASHSEMQPRRRGRMSLADEEAPYDVKSNRTSIDIPEAPPPVGRYFSAPSVLQVHTSSSLYLDENRPRSNPGRPPRPPPVQGISQVTIDEIAHRVEPAYIREVEKALSGRMSWNNVSEVCEALSKILSGCSSILAFAAGSFDNMALSFSAGCVGTVALVLLLYASFASKESLERTQRLNTTLNHVGIRSMPVISNEVGTDAP